MYVQNARHNCIYKYFPAELTLIEIFDRISSMGLTDVFYKYSLSPNLASTYLIKIKETDKNDL